MNKKFSKLTALLLSLAMALSLVLPAWALEDTDPPQWEDFGYSSLEELLTDWELTEEEYYEWLVKPVLEREQFIAQQAAQRQAWMEAHPEQIAAFDPYAYFEAKYTGYDSAQEYMEDWEMTEEEFRQEMLDFWVSAQINAEEEERTIAEFRAAHPEETAAFDPYAFFAKEYYYYDSPQEYMEWHELTEEEFLRKMLLEWIEDFQYKAEVKETLGGSALGVNVMVDGACVAFPDVRPEIISGRTMVPLDALAEHLGGQAVYDQATGTVNFAVNGVSLTHTIGADTLLLPDGSSMKMDVPSYLRDGRVMVPVRFFSQALGYEVLWDPDYQTAVLLDRQGLVREIDSQFTLFNRVLYAASGAGLAKEDQSLKQTVSYDLDVTLFDTLHGDKRIPVKLSGSALSSNQAIELHLSGNLSALTDLLEAGDLLYLDSQELSQLRGALSGFSLDAILNLELGAVYFRCPSLAKLDMLPLEDPNAWIAIPIDLSDFPVDSLTGLSSVGQLAMGSAENGVNAWSGMDTPFWYWNNISSSAYSLSEYVGDEQFTKSGSSYTLSYETTEHSWDGEQTYVLKFVITPSGEQSCTYALTFDLTSDDMALNADLSGSSGRFDLDLSLHLKNTFKFTLDGTGRTSGSNQQPLSAPPVGSKIEFPLGSIGSGSM